MIIDRKVEILQNVQNTTLPLIIYGTGMYAKIVFAFLKQHEIKCYAACVDNEYFNEARDFWNGIPVYPVGKLLTKFAAFNIIIGFYDLKLVENISIKGSKGIFFLDSKSNLNNISNLPKVEEQMRLFFNENTYVIKLPKINQLYFACLSSGVKFINYNDINDELHLLTKGGVNIITNRYFGIFNEIFCEEIYSLYKEHIKGEYIIFDIGANRGYSALYFAQDVNCLKVFSFEPDDITIEFLYKNLALNPNLSKKIKAFNYGLYDKNETLTFYQPNDGSDYVNSSETEFTDSYWSTVRKNLIQEKKVKVRRASETVKEVLAAFEIQELPVKIIKIDIEGAEYKVLSELNDSGVLNSFQIIFGECHSGIAGIMEICNEYFNLVHIEEGLVDGCFNFLIINKAYKE